MRVLMLGWEFPPFITGGLGTACYGLTKALSRQGVEIDFLLPRPVDDEHSTHVRLLSPELKADPAMRAGDLSAHAAPSSAAAGDGGGGSSGGVDGEPREEASTVSAVGDRAQQSEGDPGGEFAHVRFIGVPAGFSSPYVVGGKPTKPWSPARAKVAGAMDPTGVRFDELSNLDRTGTVAWATAAGSIMSGGPTEHYSGDMITEAKKYARLCLDLAIGRDFAVIHAHDWMTYPAGLAIAAVTGKPLVVHVHSTEFDRSGQNVNQQVYDIERRGMHGAIRVICVSHLTQTLVTRRYGVAESKTEVVYNGIDDSTPGGGSVSGSPLPHTPQAPIKRGDKIVLFLGRITMQKGPEYFVAAAKKVLEKYDRVKFVMAGSGDKIRDVIEMAAHEGIGHKVLFTGFLRGRDVERVFKMADVYVMPSVSEPFGIAPLEAIRHDVPVIVSKTSGVAEVLTHALKVDFWDIEEIANKILAVLRHPPLSSTMRSHADMEVRRLTWDSAASKCVDAYQCAREHELVLA